MKKINVGIIGFGLSGSVFHAPILHAMDGFNIMAIASSRSDKISQKYPHAKIYDKPGDLISDNDIDLVVICSPNDQHFRLTKLALENNKHVIVEKPFVIHSTEGMELISLAKDKHLLLSVYHNRRWDNDFIALKNCIKDRILGDIHYCEIRYEKFRPHVALDRWKEKDTPGFGILYDLGPHLIDQALCLFGWPNSIYADIATQREAAIAEDYFHLLLDYKKLKVVLHASSMVQRPGPRFLVHGSRGSFIKYGLDPQERILRDKVENPRAHTCENYFDNSIEVSVDHNGLNLQGSINLPMGNYQEYYRMIYHAIIDGSSVPVHAEEAVKTIHMIELAQQSHREGRKLTITHP